MNTMNKSRIGTKSDHAAIESIEVISVTMPVINPAAANSDWFEEWAPDSLEVPGYGNLPWEGEESGVEETWSRVQDIWLRMARHPGMACTTVSDPVQGEQLLMFRIQGGAIDIEGALLLEVAGCSRTYEWREEGRHGSLVSNMGWCGDTLVIDITSFHQMRAWQGGDSLVWQMQTLLRCLRAERQH